MPFWRTDTICELASCSSGCVLPFTAVISATFLQSLRFRIPRSIQNPHTLPACSRWSLGIFALRKRNIRSFRTSMQSAAFEDLLSRGIPADEIRYRVKTAMTKIFADSATRRTSTGNRQILPKQTARFDVIEADAMPGLFHSSSIATCVFTLSLLSW